MFVAHKAFRGKWEMSLLTLKFICILGFFFWFVLKKTHWAPLASSPPPKSKINWKWSKLEQQRSLQLVSLVEGEILREHTCIYVCVCVMILQKLRTKLGSSRPATTSDSCSLLACSRIVSGTHGHLFERRTKRLLWENPSSFWIHYVLLWHKNEKEKKIQPFSFATSLIKKKK